jgi:hypothetical protein
MQPVHRQMAAKLSEPRQEKRRNSRNSAPGNSTVAFAETSLFLLFSFTYPRPAAHYILGTAPLPVRIFLLS